MDRLAELGDKIVPLLRPYVKKIAVFGSFARGDETPESDIDILVELKPPGQRPSLGLKWFRLEQELGRILGREVELVSESAMSPFVRPYVEKDMVLLYEEG
ncbi:Nucleotidyltransferase domain protein [uncultured archaeon]|nr:Nucleotidyltransferase domain protein [uncultured archaeon]